jgi:hypothetical protein
MLGSLAQRRRFLYFHLRYIKKQEQPMEKRICSPLLASRHTHPSANIVIMVNSVSSLLVFLLSMWQVDLYRQLGKGWGVRTIWKEVNKFLSFTLIPSCPVSRIALKPDAPLSHPCSLWSCASPPCHMLPMPMPLPMPIHAVLQVDPLQTTFCVHGKTCRAPAKCNIIDLC